MMLYFIVLLLFHFSRSDLNCKGELFPPRFCSTAITKGTGSVVSSSCDWSCKLSLAQAGACDGEGRCLCWGERDDTDNLFDLVETDQSDAGVRLELDCQTVGR